MTDICRRFKLRVEVRDNEMQNCMQARNQGGGDKSHPRKFFAPPGKMCWTLFKTTGHSSKNFRTSLLYLT